MEFDQPDPPLKPLAELLPALLTFVATTGRDVTRLPAVKFRHLQDLAADRRLPCERIRNRWYWRDDPETLARVADLLGIKPLRHVARRRQRVRLPIEGPGRHTADWQDSKSPA